MCITGIQSEICVLGFQFDAKASSHDMSINFNGSGTLCSL